MSFRNVRITREQYQNVRRMTTDASIEKIEQLPIDRLVEIRYQFQKFAAEVTARRGEPVPVLYIEYCPAEQLKAKRWAYRKAIRETLDRVNALIKVRTNHISAFLTEVEDVERELDAKFPAPAEAVCEDEQGDAEPPFTLTSEDVAFAQAVAAGAPTKREARYLNWLKERTAGMFA